VNRLLEVSEVAEWLGVSPGWVREHASGKRKPKLPAVKIGRFVEI
jgi:DNA-binding transcriptional regulator YiaG